MGESPALTAAGAGWDDSGGVSEVGLAEVGGSIPWRRLWGVGASCFVFLRGGGWEDGTARERLRFRAALVSVLDGVCSVAMLDCSFFQLLERFLRSIPALCEVFAVIEMLFLLFKKKSTATPQSTCEAQNMGCVPQATTSRLKGPAAESVSIHCSVFVPLDLYSRDLR